MHNKRKQSMDSMHQNMTAMVAKNRTKFCTVFALTVIALPIIIWGSWAQSKSLRTKSSSKLLFQSIMTAQDTCQVTKVFPFRVGCPKQCERQSYEDEPMYRMSMAWYLGMPEMEEGTAYDRGINYQCPIDFVENFRNAENDLGNTIQRIRDVKVKYQPRMHISLNYLCCLRKNETNWARQVMNKWILDNYPYSISIKFDKIQCWHERRNSVTTIIIADEQSQPTLLQMSNDIEANLLEHGIPTEIHRTDQMPFHVTLLGIYRGSDENDPINNITSDIPYIYETVNNISTTMGSKWAGDRRFSIRHAPIQYSEAQLHAGKEPLGP